MRNSSPKIPNVKRNGPRPAHKGSFVRMEYSKVSCGTEETIIIEKLVKYRDSKRNDMENSDERKDPFQKWADRRR